MSDAKERTLRAVGGPIASFLRAGWLVAIAAAQAVARRAIEQILAARSNGWLRRIVVGYSRSQRTRSRRRHLVGAITLYESETISARGEKSSS